MEEGIMKRVRVIQTAVAAVLFAGPSLATTAAWAGHDHYVVTPNGECHQVAQGQTAIGEADHGGFHRFHDNVHRDATGESTAAPYELGDGHSRVVVYRDDCAAP